MTYAKSDMAIEIQVILQNQFDASSRQTIECENRDCHGFLYLPTVTPSELAGRLDTFRATVHCTECSFTRRSNTVPKYLSFRVVVRDVERRVSASE